MGSRLAASQRGVEGVGRWRGDEQLALMGQKKLVCERGKVLKSGLPLWFVEVVKTSVNPNERPPCMRLRKTDLTRRVNASVGLRFQATGLTSFAGLELVRRYFRSLELPQRLRRHLSGCGLENDFGVVPMVTLVLGLLICGGRRLRHVLFLQDDPLVLRLCGLKRVPTPRTVSRWLRRFTRARLDRLLAVNDELVAQAIRSSGLRRLTLDVDGSVISTGQKVEWAFRGFNPHHRKVPSYYPVTAYEAQTGQIVRVKNRPGNIQDGKASVVFLRDLFAQIRRTLGEGYRLEFRMDGAFFRLDVLQLLGTMGAEYAIKVPFYTWVGLKALIQRQSHWDPVDAAVSSFSTHLFLAPWKRTLRVVVYRKRVHHRSPKNYQLDLFDPAEGYFEYSAVVTNKTLSAKNLWYFMCGRGSHEKAYGELKNGFAFDCVPTQHYGANSAWQILSVLAFNLMKSFQVATTAQPRARSRKRRTLYPLETIQSQRYQWLNRAGQLKAPNGYLTLDVGPLPALRDRFLRIQRGLSKIA
jgi:Transposase DDE domain group 1